MAQSVPMLYLTYGGVGGLGTGIVYVGVVGLMVRWFPDRPDQSLLEVLQSADVIDDRESRDVVEQRVDGEVAAEGVFFGRTEGVVAMDQAILDAAHEVGYCCCNEH